MRFSTIFIRTLGLFASVAFALPTPSHLSARNAGLEAGTYFIINKVHDSNGAQLAITFSGQDQTATVTPFKSSDSAQKWVIVDQPATTGQSVVPFSGPTLQAAWGGSDVVKVVNQTNFFYDWIIRPSHDNGFVIQDLGKTVYWGIGSGADNAEVTIAPGSNLDEQQWFLQKV